MIHNIKTFEILLTNHQPKNKKMTIVAYSTSSTIFPHSRMTVSALSLTTYDHELATAYKHDKQTGKKNYHYLFNRKMRTRYGFGKSMHGGVICWNYQ